MRGAEQRVVGGDEPELDREADLELALADQAQHPAHRLRPVLARDRVLHLREPDAALGGEDPVAAVGPLGVRELARGEADQPRDRGGKAAPDPGEQVQGVVLEHDLVQVGADAPARARGAVDAVALDRQRRVGVGEDEELEVVVARRQLVDAGQGLLERAGRVDAMQGEGGDGTQGDRVDHPQRPEPDPGGSIGVAIGSARRPRARSRRPAPARAPRPGRRGSGTRRRCRASRSRSPRRGSGGRCRRGSPSPGRAPRAPRSGPAG